MHRFYDELAEWWYLISAPEDYAEEAQFFLEQLADITAQPGATLLELGSGGGNNAYHMQAAFTNVTLADLSPQMVALSKTLNPACEHAVGDMRTLRLGHEFDAVFIHDAIDYMTTLDDLRQALTTAYVHCRVGGVALIVPDHVRERFEASTEHGGHDGDGRSVRYLEWTHAAVPDASTYSTDYVFLLQEGREAARIVHETHTLGLFARADWLRLLEEVGFLAKVVRDDYGRDVFIGRKPAARA
jgi:ubiquinone/menaquinone biosynthesis C-methylase UbiE